MDGVRCRCQGDSIHDRIYGIAPHILPLSGAMEGEADDGEVVVVVVEEEEEEEKKLRFMAAPSTRRPVGSVGGEGIGGHGDVLCGCDRHRAYGLGSLQAFVAGYGGESGRNWTRRARGLEIARRSVRISL